jgi:pimeloyl-ACP methyl ester carboxylesterase
MRFPAAPIHSIHRLHEGHHTLGLAENFHTLRVVTRPGSDARVERIFLFHNGLNELDNCNLFYQLASQLVSSPDGRETACIMRPFPGHLTRFPFHGFAETPLDRYLWDGSHLFRQFLRFMIETQWLLSAMVRRSRYPCPSGASLLAESNEPDSSRLNETVLADAMSEAWKGMYRTSRTAVTKAREEQNRAPGMKPIVVGHARFRESIEALRKRLGLERFDRLNSEHGDADEEPSVHVIGYSLGGFLAQSVFMSWPFAVDSCSTLLSGGALRELAPTAFADPEEWQTVLHSLRYELDEGMLTGRFGYSDHRIAGIDRDLFLYLQRTFYEVFEQDYRGSFQTRLAAFRQRMLFVVGGNDPIVRPKSVLDSEPPGGINLLEIAGLGHFIGSKPNDPEETKQRRFWLPEIGGLVARFAGQATGEQLASRRETWLTPELKVKPAASETPAPAGDELLLDDSERNAFGRDGALPADLFGRYLDDLLARNEHGRHGYLWILRNEIPTFLLDEWSVQHRARALHHDDAGIIEYCRAIHRRWETLDASKGLFSIVVPWNARRILWRIDPPHPFPSQAETAVGLMPGARPHEAVWADFEATARHLTNNGQLDQSLLVFDGRRLLTTDERGAETNDRKEQESSRIRASIVQEGLALSKDAGTERADRRLRVPSLPDCWIWASKDFLGVRRRASPEEMTLKFLSAVRGAQSESSDLGESLLRDQLRIVSVSRARYNPRFQGRLVTDAESARPILLHAALCISAAKPLHQVDWGGLEREDGSDDSR